MRFNSIAPLISIYSIQWIYSIALNESLVELANDIIMKRFHSNTSIIKCTREASDILLLGRNKDVFCVRVHVDVRNYDNDRTHIV